MSPTIKNLRVSGTTVKAEVVVGLGPYGSPVSLAVTLQRLKDEDLAAAMLPLERLLLARAKAFVSSSATAAEVEEQVRALVASRSEAERHRIQANADHAAKEANRQLNNKLLRVEQELIHMTAARDRLRVDLAAAKGIVQPHRLDEGMPGD